jgi:predicted esterase
LLQLQDLRTSVSRIRDIVWAEVRSLNYQWDRVILAGIGQGATVAIHALLNLDVPSKSQDSLQPRRLGAVIAFSCDNSFNGTSLDETRRLVGLDELPEDDEFLDNTPVLLQHYRDDATVNIASGQLVDNSLVGLGAKTTWKEFTNGGHGVHSPLGVDHMVKFLHNNLPHLEPESAT